MLKYHEKALSILQKAIEFFILFAAANAVIWFFSVSFIFEDVYGRALILAGLSIYILRNNGLYRSFRLAPRSEEIWLLLKSMSIASVLFLIVDFLVFESVLSAKEVFFYFIFGSLLLLSFRLVVRAVLGRMRKVGKNLRHLILVGDGAPLADLLENIQANNESGVRFKGWYLARPDEHKDLKRILTEESFVSELKNADGVIISFSPQQSMNLAHFIKLCYSQNVPATILPDISFSILGHEVTYFAGIPGIVVNQPRFSSLDLFLKRLLDIVIAGLGLIVLAPLFLIVGVVIKMTSPGPIFFGQDRVGLEGSVFRIWKFRSMRIISDKDSGDKTPGWTVKDDPRRTKIGTFIRKTSIDELPQLWNVLVGDMSIVGPRPEQPHFVDKFKEEIPAYMLRHKMKAGITGWAQVNGWRGDTSIERRVECDIYYIKNWSISLDIKIIILTFIRGMIHKNAY